jgi:hypothetical protein
MASCLPQRMPALHAQFDRQALHARRQRAARARTDRAGLGAVPDREGDGGDDSDIRPRHARSRREVSFVEDMFSSCELRTTPA